MDQIMVEMLPIGVCVRMRVCVPLQCMVDLGIVWHTGHIPLCAHFHISSTSLNRSRFMLVGVVPLA